MHAKIGRDSDNISQRLCLSGFHRKTVCNFLSHITKSSHLCRHHNKEQHLLTVSRNQNIIELPISLQNTRTCVPLLHTNQHTHCGCNHTRPPRENKVHNSNVFGVCTTEPADKQSIPFTRRSFHFVYIFGFCISIKKTS